MGKCLSSPDLENFKTCLYKRAIEVINIRKTIVYLTLFLMLCSIVSGFNFWEFITGNTVACPGCTAGLTASDVDLSQLPYPFIAAGPSFPTTIAVGDQSTADEMVAAASVLSAF